MLTSWEPSSDMEMDLKQSMKANDEYTYRILLQQNAKKIMDENSRYFMRMDKVCSCPKCTFKNLQQARRARGA